jgi:photosystem II stability/assembly factor-like uncharacterized protein
MAKQGIARGARAGGLRCARVATGALCALIAFSESAARAGVWRSNGPSGGIVRALAVDPSTPTTAYAGSDGGGFFKTVDGGKTWKATGTDIFQIGSLDITGLVVDPKTTSRLYASANGASGFVFKSEDGGASWISPQVSDFASGIATNPQTPTTLYVSGSPDVFKSTDAGSTWTPLHLFDSFCIAIDPVSPDTLYVGSINTVAKTVDGGANWTFQTTSFAGASIDTLTVDPVVPTTVYAGASGSAVFKSTDGGKNWTAIGPFLQPFPFDATQIVVDPTNHDTIYAAGGAEPDESGVFKSIDGGAHWTPVPLLGSAVSLAMVDPMTLIAGSFVTGVSKTVDAAASWAPSGTGLAATTAVSLAIDPAHPGTVWAGLPGNHVSRTADGGASWTNPANVGLPSNAEQINAIAVDPSAPGTAYAGFFPFGGVAKTVDDGDHWTVFDAAQPNSSLTLALAVDPSDPATIYSGSFGGGVFKSTDHGVDWTAMNVGLQQVVVSLAIDPSAPDTVYAGSLLGGGFAGVYKTSNGGGQWTPMDDGLPAINGGDVPAIAIDPSAPSTVYAATSGDGVFKSIDGGTTWVAANEGLEALDITALVADAAVPGTVYAGTHFGVYTTINAGASWTRSTDGLFNLDVRSLAAEPGRVYAGTAGDGAFAMDVATTPAKTVLGRGFSVKNPGAPPARKLTASAREAGSDAPLDGAAIIAHGATLVISVTGESSGVQTFELPPPWTAAGKTGVKYSDPKGIHGPVKSLTLRKTSSGTFSMDVQLVGNTGRAPQPHIAIVPPNPGESARVLLTVNGGDAYCVGFGGASGGTIVNTDAIFSVSRPTAKACL